MKPRPQFLPASAEAEAWQLVLPGELADALDAHLFPGDEDEHGAVISAGMVRTSRGVRLLARELFVASDGVDFVPGRKAYRRLTPQFVNDHIRHCRDERLVYLAVHNHHGHGSVGFSEPDLRSHERGYPALLDIAKGMPVGALVLAHGALAGDIWTPEGTRHPIGETVILRRNVERIYPLPAAAPPDRAEIDDRQARVYGNAGQDLLGRLKVGVIGAGGVGLPIVAFLARLGVGHLVVIDPERVEITNLPRLPESTRRDAMSWLTTPGRPLALQRLGGRLATPKVRLAKRVARRARKNSIVDAVRGDIADVDVAQQLIDCDYLFLAADTHTARSIFNALVHQYLVSGVQVGSHVAVGGDGDIGKIASVLRPVTPDGGCLWCNELIRPDKLTDESLPAAVRRAQRYLPMEDAPAPSVITLNARGVADATDHFMLAVTGLLESSETNGDFRRYETRADKLRTSIPRRSPDCRECGTHASSIRARGDGARLPVRGA
jgi:ThiF family